MGSQRDFSSQAGAQSEIVSFCALVDRPAEYRDRTIRLKAVLVENNKMRVDGVIQLFTILPVEAKNFM